MVQNTRVRQRWRKDTLREVYFNNDGTVSKRYWVRPGARRYPKPWAREDAALKRLAEVGGGEFPRSHGVTETPLDGGVEFVLVRDFVEGDSIEGMTAGDAKHLASYLASVHAAGVVTDDAALDNFVRDQRGKIRCVDFGRAKVYQSLDPRLPFAVGAELAKLRDQTFFHDPVTWGVFEDMYGAARDAGAVSRWCTGVGFAFARGVRYLRKVVLSGGGEQKNLDRYGIPRFREKRYENGRLFVRPDLDCRGGLEAYISRKEFLCLPEHCHLDTNNKRYRVYSFFLPEADRDVILKVSWANPEYGWGRRMNIRVIQLLKNYARIAFKGALALDRIGIRTIRPLAYWQHRKSWCDVESYFLYEKLPAESTVLDLVQAAGDAPTASQQAKLHAVIDRTAALVRRLHDHGLRHDDVAMGNFLIEVRDSSAGESDPARRYGVAVIDTDHIHWSGLKTGARKRFFDLRDLRRLNLREADCRRFLEEYLGDAFNERWWRVYLFWRKWGKHPIRSWLRSRGGELGE